MADDPLALPQPRRRGLWITLVIIALTIAGTLVYDWRKRRAFEEEWSRLGVIEPSGGLRFPVRVVLDVPLFRQADPEWRHDRLGETEDSMAEVGCAVSSAAMVLASYGIRTDPGLLNRVLSENRGYEGAGWIIWERAAELMGNQFEKAYEDLPSYRLIDENLLRGNPVIVRLRNGSGRTHFVVIAGKEGYDYLTRDPGAGAEKGLYPLREYGSKIEALRFYRKR